jgi:hypothetical protein
MRIASRVIGVALALAGIAFFVVSFFIVTGGFDRRSVLVDSGPDRTEWIAGSFSAALGAGFILAGLYYLKFNVHELDQAQERPASRLASYLANHRRALKVVAQAGLVVSLIRLAAACFGQDWPSEWAALPLSLVLISLVVVAGQVARGNVADHLDWEQVPARVRPALRILWKAVGPALLILGLLFAWSQWRHQESSPVVQKGFVVILFAWAAIFFAYGDIRAGEKHVTR